MTALPVPAMSWMIYGRWPSTHDLDLMLDADPTVYETIRSRTGADQTFQLRHLGDRGIKYCGRGDIPLPDHLIAEAIATADGLPLDLALIPSDDWSLKAILDPPYDLWPVFWRRTSPAFWVNATPLGDHQTIRRNRRRPSPF